MAERPLYDDIGAGYPATRRADPRIAALIDEALGDARTVVNVGAGTGNYEPADREVTAVEPSAAMIAQRPPAASPAVQARAEELPFLDASFDAAMAVMTIHHWSDFHAGAGELRRVARGPIVIFTWDPAMAGRSWLVRDYLPELIEVDVLRFPKPEDVAAALGGAEIRAFPIPHDCQDGFIEAWWARPEAYLDPAVRDGCSGMRELDRAVIERFTTRLRTDLETGEWDRRHGRLRRCGELDLGYRLVAGSSVGMSGNV